MRIEGWESRLTKYVETQMKKRFKWGKSDCLIFACDWSILCCGIDPMKRKKPADPETIRGAYTTEEEAKALIKQYRKSLPDIMDVHFQRQAPRKAKRGDIMMGKTPHGNAFGVNIGRGVVMFKAQKGILTMKARECSRSWSVK